MRRTVDDGWRYQAVADGYGVSVRTVAKWVQRFRQLGAAGLEDGSSRPQQTPHITSPGRCCMNTRCGWGGVARTSRDPPQEPHYGDEVEGSSHV